MIDGEELWEGSSLGVGFLSCESRSKPLNSVMMSALSAFFLVRVPLKRAYNVFTEFIDHIVFGKRGIQLVDRSSFRHMTFRQADKESWDKISDHCPVIVEMSVP